MAADVSSVVGIINGGYNDDQQAMNKESRGVVGGKSTVLITRDLLGGCYALDSKELDLDLQVPTGWEKRLDLKVYNPTLFTSFLIVFINFVVLMDMLEKMQKIHFIPFLVVP